MTERSYKVNGIDLHSFLNPHLNSFCISVYVRAGSLFEDDSECGITHLLEHSIYRNLKKHYDNLYELMSFYGLDMSATTYKEFVVFSVEGPDESFDLAADIILHIFDEISLDKEEFRLEKERIYAEIYESDEKNTVGYRFRKVVWNGTGVQKSTLGCCSGVEKISLKKLNSYRKKVFAKDNLFVYVTGNVKAKSIESLKNKLSDVEINNCSPDFENKVNSIGGFFNRDKNITVKSSDWTYIQIGFDVETQRYKSGVHALLYAVLFKGDNALFYNTVSEDRALVYSYDATYEQYDDVSNLCFKFETDPQKLYQVFTAVAEMLNDFKNGRFNFESFLNREKINCKRELDNAGNLNWSLAYYNHILKSDGIDYAKENCGIYNDLTKEEVVNAAKEIFKTSNMTIAMRGNKRRIDVDKIYEIMKSIN